MNTSEEITFVSLSLTAVAGYRFKIKRFQVVKAEIECERPKNKVSILS